MSRSTSFRVRTRSFSALASSYNSEVASYTSSISELRSENQNLTALMAGYNNTNSSDVFRAWIIHLSKLDNLDVTGAVQDYTPNATVIWSGTTQGMGGTYTGQSNIGVTLKTLLGGATSFSIVIESFNVTRRTTGTADIVTSLGFGGSDHILGNINGTIAATYEYVNQNGIWLISQENWNFMTFNVQFGEDGTTFPQWQLTGPPVPQRFSESPFKNWVYFDGGVAAAMLVVAYLATLPIAIYIRKKRSAS